MTQKRKTGQTAPIDTFGAAFLKLMKCTDKEIEIRMINDDEEAFVIYQEKAYKISTWETLCDYIEYQLTDKDAAQHINLSIWIHVTKNTVSINRFLNKLVEKIDDADEANLLNLALSINSFSDDQYETFWRTLKNIDKQGTLLGNALVSAREIYSGDGLLEDLTDTMIMDGIDLYNMCEGGIFETVHLKQETGDENTFYVYSVDDIPE